MTSTAQELAERAWISIAYARAEVMRSHLDSEAFLRVLAHLDDALDDLQTLTPQQAEAPREGQAA